MIDPATLVGAGGAVAVLWGGSKLIAWVNRPKDKQLPRTENITNQITSLEHWHMLWSHPDNNTEFYAWDDDKGWVERDINRVVKDMLGWNDYSYDVRSKVDRKIGTQWVDGEWGVDHLEKVLDYGIFLVKDLLVQFSETEKQQQVARKRRDAERKKIEAASRQERMVKLEAEYAERERIDKAWQESGKCRFCAGPRRGFSRDFCSTCWYTPGSELPSKLSKHPDEFKTPIRSEPRRGIFTTTSELRYGEFEYPQRWALDSGTNPALESRLRRIANQIRQCDDSEMKRRLIRRLDELENE